MILFPRPFSITLPDIAAILVLSLIVFGPKKLPEVGREIGQAMREMRNWWKK